MSQILAYALQVLQVLPQLIAAGQSVTQFINQANAALQKMQAEGRDPTPTEWDTLNFQIDELRKQLHGNQGVDIRGGTIADVTAARKVTIAQKEVKK